VPSDIYSMGVTAFYLLTGEWPRQGRTQREVAESAIAGRGPLLRDLAPHAPIPVVRVVNRAMDLDPGRRHSSAAELAASFGAAGRDLGRQWQRKVAHTGHELCLGGAKYRGRHALAVCMLPKGRRYDVEVRQLPSGRRVRRLERSDMTRQTALQALRLITKSA